VVCWRIICSSSVCSLPVRLIRYFVGLILNFFRLTLTEKSIYTTDSQKLLV
jgi:hypothetical protein